MVLPGPLVQQPSEVMRRYQDDEVQTFTAGRPDESLTERVGPRSPGRRFQHAQAQVVYALVQYL